MQTDQAAEKPHVVQYILFWRRPQLGCRALMFALFIQSPQNLKSEVLGFTKSKSVHYSFNFQQEIRERAKPNRDLFCNHVGLSLAGHIPCESYLEGHGRALVMTRQSDPR